MNLPTRTILITGTTSGIGFSLMKHYVSLGCRVVAVNRREDSQITSNFPSVKWECLDITSLDAVTELLVELARQGFSPDVFILNAGINRTDHVGGLDFANLKKVMEINFFGVMTFVAALQSLKWQNRRILTISSTSNIVPNPGHLGYYLSKKSLKEFFEFLAMRDHKNHYQTVVLGPVHTNIMAGYPPLSGFQKHIFNALAVSSDTAATKIARFVESTSVLLNYPKRAWLFYQLVRLGLYFFPFLYRGTEHPQNRPSSLEPLPQ